MKLAEASVEIKLQTKGFLSGLRRTENQTERSTKKIGRTFSAMGKSIGRTVAKIGASLLSAFGFVAIIRGIRSVSDELDQLAKRARTIGISPQQLAGMGFAIGQTSGLSSKQGQVAIERFTKRTGEAMAGSGEGASVLNALGLNTAEFQRADPFGRLTKFGDALRGVTDRGLKLTYVQKLLGDEARQMLPLLEMSNGEFSALIKKHQELRGNITTAALASERIGDAFDRSGQAFRSVADSIVIVLEPALVKVAGGFVKLAQTMDLFGETVTRILPGLTILGALQRWANQGQTGTSGGGGGGLEDLVTPGGRMNGGRVGLNTQLGTFNISSNDVLNTLRNIAKSNTALVALAKARRGDPLT